MSVLQEARTVTEVRAPGDVPLWVHPEWAERFPFIVQGTTGRGDGAEPFDLGLSGSQPVGAVLGRWRALAASAGMETVVHARQVHAADIWIHRERGGPGVMVMDGFDGHVTDRDHLLLSVSIADCVPVFIVDPEARAVALLHSGWRGTAAGIVERGIHRLVESWQGSPERLWLHCGPSICGECYEVGPEVHEGVYPGRQPPAANTPIDLRAAIAGRAVAEGLRPDRVTTSTHCTLCGDGHFFSHRGGSPGRQMGVLGLRAAALPAVS